MSEQDTGVSRRNFLRMVGAAGGAAAVHETMVAMGLMNHPKAWAGPPECRPGIGRGKRVLILGGGVGGLGLAHMLQKCDYDVTVLEADDRLGGRNHTARRGSLVHEEGSAPQVCRFDPGLYLNLGPGRIPYYHLRAMNLCRELGVPLEVYVHTTETNAFMAKGSGVHRRRALEYDAQGYIADLLSKAINQGALDEHVTEGDRDKLRSLLRKFGHLGADQKYKGTTRAGCPLPPNVKLGCPDAENRFEPLGLTALLDTGFWDPCRLGEGEPACREMKYSYGYYQATELLWHTTSFQPVGGMDRIVNALAEKLRAGGAEIVTGAVVRRIRHLRERGQVAVEVAGRSPYLGDFCASNIPFSIYRDIETPDASDDYRAAIDRRTFSNACKVGWQANRRFWELDEQIYGGISWTQHPITQMWYPSNDYFADKGVLTGAYNYGDTAKRFGELSLGRRLELAYAGGRQLHGDAFAAAVPQHLGVSIAWQRARYQRGCGAQWILPGDDGPTREQKTADYRRLLFPDLDGRFFAVGDQISKLPAWQEGALMSAEHVFRQITGAEHSTLQELQEQVDEAPLSLDVMG